METVAVLPPDERAALFQETAATMGISTVVVEKDFWVCFTLSRVFGLAEMPALVFKGGTSLSKAYRVIERFSEDIDITINRADLGFSGEDEPSNIDGTNARKRKLKELKEAAQRFVGNELQSGIAKDFENVLSSGDDWDVSLDKGDSAHQTLVFKYPPALELEKYSAGSYIRPFVKLEMGVRGGTEPAHTQEITSFAAEHFADYFSVRSARIHTLAAERTFWEKVTLLHDENHRPHKPAGGAWKEKSRHCYDIVMLAQSEIGARALADVGLLITVAGEKEVYFRNSWSRYEDARPGSLRIVPSGDFERALAADYPRMQQDMVFGDSPDWNEILAALAALEAKINNAS